MTGGLRIFEIKLPVIGVMAAWRDFAEQLYPYRIECSGDTWLMTIRDAVRLGRCADTIVRRFEVAARRGGVKVGAVFRRKDTTDKLIVELGIDDDSMTYLQLFELPRIALEGEQAEELLAALCRIGNDASRLPGGPGGLGLAR